MKKILLDTSYADDFVKTHQLNDLKKSALAARELLLNKTGFGNDFLGWVDLPGNYDREEFARIKVAAEKINEESEVLVVIGIGGSYLGARAAVEFCLPHFYNQLSREERGCVEIYFAGNNISGDYLNQLIHVIGDRDFSVNVISKSGTTTEPAIAFRIFKKLLESRYGKKEAANRIYATTDRAKGALKTQADAAGYETFVVPDDVGGRYSVLTAVGLLPIAAAGIDIDALMQGAADQREQLVTEDFDNNMALQYAVYRNAFLNQGKSMELMASYTPSLHMTAEWWKQLYGESEGKDGKGLFTASYDLSTDLHSLGQFVQDGTRVMFETVLDLTQELTSVVMEEEENDLDGLNYLTGKTMQYVNQNALKGVMLAHIDGGVPQLRIELPEQSSYVLGQLFYFFEFACGVSGYMLGVNPFDQPGVEFYKKNMFSLLGKPNK